MKKTFLAISLATLSCVSYAQSGTNSPYSLYGLGTMADQSLGANRGMNGVGIAIKEHNQVNYLNPASYSKIDSLTFIFDVGMSLQSTNFSENGTKKNANTANLEYVVGAFRAAKNVGVSFGILPFSNIGYNYTTSETLKGYSPAPYLETEVNRTQTFTGSGGLHQIYLGGGWEPIKGLAIGANVSYIWGTMNRNVSSVYSDNNIKSIYKAQSSTVNNIKFDFGAMYTFKLNKNDALTLGVTYTPARNLGADADCSIITLNSQSSVTDTTKFVNNDGYNTPAQLGLGVAYDKSQKLKLAFDYTLQKWSTTEYPVYVTDGNTASYKSVSNNFDDRHKFNLGGQYCTNEYSRSFAQRIRYRAGVSYTTPYLKINGQQGPKEISASLGIGIPIVNMLNNRSILNIGIKYTNLSAKDMLTENTICFNIGLTFNENWFSKWKFQ